MVVACTMAAKGASGRENQGNFPLGISVAWLLDREFCIECLVLPRKLGVNFPSCSRAEGGCVA